MGIRQTLACIICVTASWVALPSVAAPQASDTGITPFPPCPAKFVTALATGTDGSIWVGTENAGVFRLPPGGTTWNHFTRASTGGSPEKDGPVLTTGTPDVNALGDDCAYALACDKLGRVWVGHLNHGVSVFNGEKWRNYDVVSGPLGERVFAIKTCPVNGDVWMATSAGLARYSLKDDTWSYITRADGLPSDQIQAIAFSKNGTLYAGTQCDGIAVCVPSVAGDWMKYKNWRCVTGSDAIPLTAAGTGLPSGLINDMLVAKDGTVYAATTTGLAWSRDRGTTWQFLRGADWLGKAQGLYNPPAKEKLDAAAKSAPKTLLLEDYCTSLAEDATGTIWVGHWREGCEAVVMKSGAMERVSAMDGKRYAWCLLAPPGIISGQVMLAGNYDGGGICAISGETAAPATSYVAGMDNKPAPLPLPAKPPLPQEIATLTKKLQTNPVQFQSTLLHEDWMTWGDWTGRYGRAYTMLMAMEAGNLGDPSREYGGDLTYGNGCSVTDAHIGPHHGKNDALRHWIEWLSSDNKRVLYTPTEGIRRESECDDHGEAYPRTHDGPDIVLHVKIPTDGIYRLSLYFFNPNGRAGIPSQRDYLVEIMPDMGQLPSQEFSHTRAGEMKEVISSKKKTSPIASSSTILVKTRVRAFAGGGVYKQFLVKGGTQYIVRVRRNYSFNTILNGLFIDRLVGEAPYNFIPSTPTPSVRPFKMSASSDYAEMCGMELADKYKPPALPKHAAEATAVRDGLELLMQQPQTTLLDPAFRALLYRCAAADAAEAPVRQGLAWGLAWWDDELRKEFVRTMASGFWYLQKNNPEMQTKKWRYSPNTYDTPEEWKKHNPVAPP